MCPEADEDGGGADGVGETVGERRLGEGVADGDGVVGRAVGDAGRAVADTPGRASCVVAFAAVIGRARGGSYAVPAITVCTPHHDNVTAAPVASDHAST